MRRKLASQMRNPIFLAKRRQFRRGRKLQAHASRRGGACPSFFDSLRATAPQTLRESLRSLRLCVIFFFSPTFSSTRHRDPRARIHVNPKISVSLFTGIMPSKNALHLQFVLASQRRNLNALPAACLKFPPVVTALQILPIESPVRKRNAPMRTRIPHRERFALSRAPQYQRNFQQHRRPQMVAGNFRASQRRIPEVPQKSSIAFGNSLSRRFAVRPQQTSYRFAHSFFPLLPWVNPSSQFNVPQHSRRVHLPKRTALRQRHRSISLRIAATPASIQLRVSDFGGILSEEQIDVRRFLLADPATLASVASSFFFLRYSVFTAHYSLFIRGLPWP